MPDLEPKPDLMPALGRLVQGLSALFWGLPLALIVSLQTGRAEWLNAFGPFPVVAVGVLLLYGLYLLSFFRTQERVWVRALDRARLLAVINVGLSPFLYWWHRMPQVAFYGQAIAILVFSGLAFLFNLNLVVCQLSAMLPDATLRLEARFFTVLNRGLLVGAVLYLATGAALSDIALPAEAGFLVFLVFVHARLWILGFLVLLPVAMTMALLWKIKETIMSGVFQSGGE